MPSSLWPILPMNTMDSQDGLKAIALPLFLNIFFHFQMDWFGKCHALVSECFSLKISLDHNIPDIVKHRIHVWLIFILSISSYFPAQAMLSMFRYRRQRLLHFLSSCVLKMYLLLLDYIHTGDTVISNNILSPDLVTLYIYLYIYSYISC